MKIALAVVLLFGWACEDRGQKVCLIGELGYGSGVCNVGDEGERNCHAYCQSTFGTTRSECKAGSRGSHQCFCAPDCAMATWFGDPYYTTFDSAEFYFQNLCEHLGLKLINPRPEIPKFEIRLVNKKKKENEVVSYPYKFKFNVQDWNLRLTVIVMETFTVQMNDQPVSLSLPFHFQQSNDFAVNFLNISQSGEKYHLDTSFGVSMEINPRVGIHNVYIRIPNTPQFRDNIEGIFGRFDGRIALIGRNGQEYNPQSKTAVAEYGKTWCFNRDKRSNTEPHQTMNDCLRNYSLLDQLCIQPLLSQGFAQCYRYNATIAIDECINDVCHLADDGQEFKKGAACGIIEAHAKMCGIENVWCKE